MRDVNQMNVWAGRPGVRDGFGKKLTEYVMFVTVDPVAVASILIRRAWSLEIRN